MSLTFVTTTKDLPALTAGRKRTLFVSVVCGFKESFRTLGFLSEINLGSLAYRPRSVSLFR
jgi:hypothetical protein